MTEHVCCWHEFTGEERGPGGRNDLRVCCHCGAVEQNNPILDPTHGPHHPRPRMVPKWDRVE